MIRLVGVLQQVAEDFGGTAVALWELVGGWIAEGRKTATYHTRGRVQADDAESGREGRDILLRDMKAIGKRVKYLGMDVVVARGPLIATGAGSVGDIVQGIGVLSPDRRDALVDVARLVLLMAGLSSAAAVVTICIAPADFDGLVEAVSKIMIQ